MPTYKMPKVKKKIKRLIIPIIIIIISIVGYSMYLESLNWESTEDAYVETHTVQVAPKISGQIINMYVNDNQHVNAGDLVAEIDPADYRAKFAEVSARYDSALLKQKNARAVYSSATSQMNLAKKNLDRFTKLYQAGAASQLDYDNAKTAFDSAKSNLTQAKENLLSKNKRQVADADLKQIAAGKKQAELALSYTRIYAPQSGFVSNKNIEKGSIVQAGQPLFTVVPDKVWIIANFKENQLENIRPGEEVKIKIDTYPNHEFEGKVDSIQRSSGAKSSLFPPENAVGSFVKIVQRIPVKIIFTEKIDESKYTIVSGMSVEPKVRVKK